MFANLSTIILNRKSTSNVKDNNEINEIDTDLVAALVPQIDTVTLATPAVTDTPAATNFEKPSPTSIYIPAMGSSRSTGGLFCGRVYGNVPNHADFDANFATTLELGRPTKGEVCLYMMDQYPCWTTVPMPYHRLPDGRFPRLVST